MWSEKKDNRELFHTRVIGKCIHVALFTNFEGSIQHLNDNIHKETLTYMKHQVDGLPNQVVESFFTMLVSLYDSFCRCCPCIVLLKKAHISPLMRLTSRDIIFLNKAFDSFGGMPCDRPSVVCATIDAPSSGIPLYLPLQCRFSNLSFIIWQLCDYLSK